MALREKYRRRFNTQPPEGGWVGWLIALLANWNVSTHSRLKAAGDHFNQNRCRGVCFNTQPPEGGWTRATATAKIVSSFNTQPPEGGWFRISLKNLEQSDVSTHSRLKAAGSSSIISIFPELSFNTQPPEGGWPPEHQPPARPHLFQHTAA